MKSADVKPLHRVKHLKRGSSYEILGKGELQSAAPVAEGECLVVYRCLEDGRLWIRPLSEFIDGRFEEQPNMGSIFVGGVKVGEVEVPPGAERRHGIYELPDGSKWHSGTGEVTPPKEKT